MVEENWILKVFDQSNLVQRRALSTGHRYVIGRAPEADIQIVNTNVSRQHAELAEERPGVWTLRDLGSRNGTFVNGQPANGTAVSSRDLIQIDTCFIKLFPPVLINDFDREAPGDCSHGALATLKRLDEFSPSLIQAFHIHALIKLASQFLTAVRADDRMELLCRLFVSEVFRGYVAVCLRCSREGALEQRPEVTHGPICGVGSGREGPYYLSRSVLESVLKHQVPVVGTNTVESPARDGAVQLSLANTFAELAVIACPLKTEPSYVDVVYACFPADRGTGEWLALSSLSVELFQQATATFEARRSAEEKAILEGEIIDAAAIQTKLLPSPLDVAGLDVTFSSEPCQRVGGDYVDCFSLPDGRVFICVMDVSGHGLQATLTMVRLHALIHAGLSEKNTLEELLARLNTYLFGTLPDTSFVTAICMAIDCDSGSFEYVNAGHPKPFVLSGTGSPRDLSLSSCIALGIESTFVHPVEHAVLDSGDVMLLYTDGISELVSAQTGNMIGSEGIRDVFQKVSREPTTAGMSAVFKAWLEVHTGNTTPKDDRTFILLRRK
jgi:serine phosphatase RsbU (regulator of sigma subunit)